ncbi:hypothetical protein A9310_20395 [Gordonia sp. UCD-TK1]|nr:hypothetical protein A9310_20395 [Gordonia sp. UCD-TK1]
MVGVEGKRQLDAVVVVEVGQRQPDQGASPFANDRHRVGEEAACRRHDEVGAVGGLQQGAGPGGAGEVVEAQPQNDCPTDPFGRSESFAQSFDDRGDGRLEVGLGLRASAERAL